MKVLYTAEDRVLKEIEQICDKPAWSPSDIEALYKMVDIVKDVEDTCLKIETVKAMKDAGYSQANYSYEQPESMRSMRSMRSYDDDYSMRRGRDSMGRFTSRDDRGGYSGHDDPSAIDILRDKMYAAPNEAEREKYRWVIEQLSR